MKKLYILLGTIMSLLFAGSNLYAQKQMPDTVLTAKVRQAFLEMSGTNPKINVPASSNNLKSAGIFHKLDSIVRFTADSQEDLKFDSKEAFFYNPDSLCHLRLDYVWDGEFGQWKNHRKYQENLNTSKDTTVFMDFTWTSETGEWTPYSKTIVYGDNSMDGIKQQDLYIYNSAAGAWLHFASGIQEWQNNENGPLMIVSMWMLDYSTMQLEKFMRAETQYDHTMQLLSTVYYGGEPDVEEWIADEKYIYLYKSQTGLTETETAQKWNSDSIRWENDWQTRYTYDDRLNLTFEISYTWQVETGTWKTSSLAESRYDSENNYLGTTYLNRDPEKDDWINASRLEIITDNNFDNYDMVYSDWDTTLGNWLYTAKIGFDKRITVPQDYLVMPERWYFPYQTWAIGNQTYHEWDAETQTWKIINKSEVHYSVFNPSITAISENIASKVLIYPNPASTRIHIAGSLDWSKTEMRLFDIDGRQIELVKSNASMNVEHLKAGVYFIHVMENGKVITIRKLLKK